MKIKKLEFKKSVFDRNYSCSNKLGYFLLEGAFGIRDYGIRYYPWQTPKEADMDYFKWMETTDKYSLEDGIEYLQSEYEKRVIESIKHPEKSYWKERKDKGFIYVSFLVTPLGDFASIVQGKDGKFTLQPIWDDTIIKVVNTLAEAEQIGIEVFNSRLQEVIQE